MTRYTIAIVDDDRRMCETLKRMIRTSSAEYRVVCAHDGKKGLAMINRLKPEIAILDINMPRMNGLKVLEKLKTGYEFLHTDVIILTGSDSPEDAEASIYWYAESFLKKPCSRESVMAAISRLLSSREGAASSSNGSEIEGVLSHAH
jgi:DNA-binding response OmpR family regulator